MGNIDFDMINEARKILGLGKKATLKEIKNAYREKAKEHHPDSSRSGGGEEQIQKIRGKKIMRHGISTKNYWPPKSR